MCYEFRSLYHESCNCCSYVSFSKTKTTTTTMFLSKKQCKTLIQITFSSRHIWSSKFVFVSVYIPKRIQIAFSTQLKHYNLLSIVNSEELERCCISGKNVLLFNLLTAIIWKLKSEKTLKKKYYSWEAKNDVLKSRRNLTMPLTIFRAMINHEYFCLKIIIVSVCCVFACKSEKHFVLN